VFVVKRRFYKWERDLLGLKDRAAAFEDVPMQIGVVDFSDGTEYVVDKEGWVSRVDDGTFVAVHTLADLSKRFQTFKELTRELKLSGDDVVRGWKGIARVLGLHERNVRRAYKEDPEFRAYIHKTGGTWWANPGELWNLRAAVLNRREGGEARRVKAQGSKHDPQGRFTKKAPRKAGLKATSNNRVTEGVVLSHSLDRPSR